MWLLEIKLILTPLVVLAASLAARRWGDAIGGWLVGLPLTSAPVSVFLAVEQGPHFAAEAANGSLGGVVAQAVFCLGYTVFAPRGVAAALAAGAVGYAILAGALVAAGPPRFMLFLGAVVALTLVLRFVPRGKPTSAKAFGSLDIALRVAVTTALVIGLTAAAGTLGPWPRCGSGSSYGARTGGMPLSRATISSPVSVSYSRRPLARMCRSLIRVVRISRAR